MKKRQSTIRGAVVVNADDDEDDDDDDGKRRRRGGRTTTRIVPSMTSSPNARRGRRRRNGRDEGSENGHENENENDSRDCDEAFLVENEKENERRRRRRRGQSDERLDRGGEGGGATPSTTQFEWVDDGARRAYEMYLSYYRAAAFSQSTGNASETFARMAAAAAARRVPAMYGNDGGNGGFYGLSLCGSSVPADGGEDEDAARAKRWPVVPQVSTAVCPPRSESVRATPPGFFTTKRQAVNAGVQAGSAAKTMAKQMMREAPTRGEEEEQEASRSSQDKGATAKRVEEAKALLDPSNALDRSALERDTKATRNDASRRRRSERSNAPSPESSLAISIEGVLGGRKSAAPSA